MSWAYLVFLLLLKDIVVFFIVAIQMNCNYKQFIHNGEFVALDIAACVQP